MSEQLLQVRNLSVSVEDKPILHGIDLEVRPGETHVLMGPNGAGKSTLGYTIMGSPRYEVTDGEDPVQREGIIRGNCRPESQGRYFPILPESPGGTRSISSEFHP